MFPLGNMPEASVAISIVSSLVAMMHDAVLHESMSHSCMHVTCNMCCCCYSHITQVERVMSSSHVYSCLPAAARAIWVA